MNSLLTKLTKCRPVPGGPYSQERDVCKKKVVTKKTSAKIGVGKDYRGSSYVQRVVVNYRK